MRNDRGGVIVGYFTKIAVVLALFAIVCFDAVSVGVARVGIEDTAKGTALAGAEAWNTSKDVNYAYRVAVQYAEERGATVNRKSFKIDENGVVSVAVTKEATTLLLYRTKKTSKWAKVAATGSGRTV